MTLAEYVIWALKQDNYEVFILPNGMIQVINYSNIPKTDEARKEARDFMFGGN